MRTVLLMAILFASHSAFCQKKELQGAQTYWKDIKLPRNESGLIEYTGDIVAPVPLPRLYRRGIDWVLINNHGPYNKLISRDPQGGQLIFQRSFNYFWNTSGIPTEDNQVMTYLVRLDFYEGRVQYKLSNFQHDHQGRLMDLETYLKLPQNKPPMDSRILSQVVMHIEGFIWSNGEEKGFVENLHRIMNTEYID